MSAGLFVLAAASTPSPSPAPSLDPDSVTPGLVGFGVTFLIAVAVVLLILDMVRRIRRVRYRDEIRQKLDAEQLQALEDDVAPGGAEPPLDAGDQPDETRNR